MAILYGWQCKSFFKMRSIIKQIRGFLRFFSVEGVYCDICHGWFQVFEICLWLHVPCGPIESPAISLCQSYGIIILKVELNNQSSLLNCQSSHFRWVNICYPLDTIYISFSSYLWYRINLTDLCFKMIKYRLSTCFFSVS